ncbi:IS66 family transposase [Bacteroides caecimuris]|uniref:Transposase n=1 Tax=Bacteroides caecimuris TaxID=1796613 RepID=A0A1C7GXN1_9BACE|nr:IS66 family transposase [Bacteroides caecimuris]ANU57039.1 transposase [Bacteroides caecimuris]OXE64877.1 transposase [Bacteroides caecimuris]QQR18100.1 IS66 family transposase [Bacteroides caecimuris]UQA31102.1 IS66 family transposase [Bacteroides caecimuris]
MIDERAYELLCCQLGLANEEKAGLRKQVNELIARLKAIEESNKENSKALVDTINELSVTVENYRKEMELMRKQLEAKDEVNRMLANEISNLRLQLEDSRKHRFGRTSEQRKLLNNRNLDKSALHKSEYDGSDRKDDDNDKADGNETGSSTTSGSTPAQDSQPSRRKETAPRAVKTKLKVDKVVVHEVDEYYTLPEGGRFMNRNGMPDVWEYRVIEHVRAHNVEHVYKVARVKLADGTFANTMEHPLKDLGGIFSPELLARLLCLKYDFSMPENRQIRLLAREGIHISNTTLNSYIHNGIAKLKGFIGEVFKGFVQQAEYLMVDETTELVGIETKEGKAYRRKYLWAFFAKHMKMVYYHYNNGSRSSDVAKSFLEHFMGTLSTDGYTVYRMFDGEDSKVLHIGCWTHCRRLWVDALPSDRTAMEIIDSIGDMFMNEELFRTMKLSGEQIKGKRRQLTGPILESIHHKVVMMMQDAKIMANELMRKAVNYTLNQWKSLRNILKDGAAEISNNLCEQRMKPVKLLLKNCMNIGSEDAAENSAFIFSLIESCKLNGIDPQDYLKHLFECILHGKDCDKKTLLPCFYKPEC